jgi:hypothetical protein
MCSFQICFRQMKYWLRVGFHFFLSSSTTTRGVRKRLYKFFSVKHSLSVGCTIARVVSCSLSTAEAHTPNPGQVMWNLWSTKRHWDRFTSISLAKSNSTKWTIFIYHPGWYNKPISDRRTEWTQSHPTHRERSLISYTIRRSYVTLILKASLNKLPTGQQATAKTELKRITSQKLSMRILSKWLSKTRDWINSAFHVTNIQPWNCIEKVFFFQNSWT